jgi:uncharacterized membrane protein
MVMLFRFLRHLYCAYWQARRHFPDRAREQIAQAIGQAEAGHNGEICFVVEASLTPRQLLAQTTARERALDLFAELHVWDTAHNSGVLVYLLLADRAVEIVADRGLHPHGDTCWPQAAERIRRGFQAGDAGAGCIEAVALIGDFLRQRFPTSGPDPDELPNSVRML